MQPICLDTAHEPELVQCPKCGHRYSPFSEQFISALKQIERDMGYITVVSVANRFKIGRATAWRRIKPLEDARILYRSSPKTPLYFRETA